MKKLVCGAGLNDVRGLSGGLFYMKWREMLRQSYVVKNGRTVCDEWLYFSAFLAWMQMQDWEGKYLDLSILGDKIYSPETCCFAPKSLQGLLNDCEAIRGKYPVGVHLHGSGRYEAKVRYNGKTTHIGYYSNVVDAAEAYRVRKNEIITEQAMLQTDPRIREGLLRKLTPPVSFY